MFKSREIYIICVFICLVSCIKYYDGNRNEFFKYSKMDYDVCRLPLKYPYQLVTSSNNVDAMLIDRNLMNVCKCSGYLTEVNVEKDWILMKGKIVMHDEVFCAVHIKDSLTYFLKDKADFVKFCDSVNIIDQLYSVEETYFGWMKGDTLPWVKDGSGSKGQCNKNVDMRN